VTEPTPIYDASLVDFIRAVCAIELENEPSYPWFHLSCDCEGGRYDEHDECLLSMFETEYYVGDQDRLDTVLILCHG